MCSSFTCELSVKVGLSPAFRGQLTKREQAAGVTYKFVDSSILLLIGSGMFVRIEGESGNGADRELG